MDEVVGRALRPKKPRPSLTQPHLLPVEADELDKEKIKIRHPPPVKGLQAERMLFVLLSMVLCLALTSFTTGTNCDRTSIGCPIPYNKSMFWVPGILCPVWLLPSRLNRLTPRDVSLFPFGSWVNPVGEGDSRAPEEHNTSNPSAVKRGHRLLVSRL